MPEKKAFLLRLDPKVYEALAKWAADELRSLNGQIEWVLRAALHDAGRTPRAERDPPGARTGAGGTEGDGTGT